MFAMVARHAPGHETQKTDTTSKLLAERIQRIFSICSATSARFKRKSDDHIDPAPLAGTVSCLLHRQANGGVEVCSVSRQNR